VRLLLDDQGRSAAIGAAAREGVLEHATVEQYADRLLDVCRLALAPT
jgi:hypothetical protein